MRPGEKVFLPKEDIVAAEQRLFSGFKAALEAIPEYIANREEHSIVGQGRDLAFVPPIPGLTKHTSSRFVRDDVRYIVSAMEPDSSDQELQSELHLQSFSANSESAGGYHHLRGVKIELNGEGAQSAFIGRVLYDETEPDGQRIVDVNTDWAVQKSQEFMDDLTAISKEKTPDAPSVE